MFVFISSLFLFFCHVHAQCKNLELPWGTYPAKFDQKTKICVYSNVRFAQPPVAQLRFQAPLAPLPSASFYAGPVSCVAVDSQEKCVPGGDIPAFTSDCPNATVGLFQEDCLFLDIYVPLAVLQSTTIKASVAVWFFGGAYVFGSKNEFDITKLPLYSGVGLLSATPEPLIFVAGNYRLGAFGWLAGSYLENNGAPNAGLLDQRMILQFVQKYISKVNGNPTSVSAWGESAGAGSILHHLVAANGQQDPLFSRAILQSPAYQWQWDRFGILNDTYTYFAKLAGCPTGDISCLQSTNQTALQTANQALFRSKYACQGIFPVGPSVDKSLIPTLPPVAFQNGQYWKNLDSIIISHVSDEVQYNGSFLPYPIRQNPTAANFDNFLKAFMFDDKLAALRSNIDAQYPVSKYKNDQIRRTGVVIRDASFTCNTRQLFDAYSGKINTYMMDYHLLGDDDKAVHGSDIIPTFVNNGIDVSSLLQKCYGVPWAKATAAGIYIKTFFAPAYQSYLKSFAIHKDPNLGAIGGAKKVKWTPAYTSKEDGHNSVRNVLLPYYAGILGGPDFKILPKDPNNTAASCTFWNQLATNITKIVGSNLEYPALRIQTGEESGRFDL